VLNFHPIANAVSEWEANEKNANFRYLIIGREPGAQKNQWFYLDKIVIYGKEK